MVMEKEYKTFKEFYPFYLSQHSNKICRSLHYFGTTLVLAGLFYFLSTAKFHMIPILFVAGYGPAWIGHFGFEKNRPATFKYPIYSFAADFVMYYQFITFKGYALQTK